MKRQRCENCRFWNALDQIEFHRTVQKATPDELAELVGQCRRRSPIVFVNGDQGAGDDDPIWPVTKLGDWCGEHEMAVGLGPVEISDVRSGMNRVGRSKTPAMILELLASQSAGMTGGDIARRLVPKMNGVKNARKRVANAVFNLKEAGKISRNESGIYTLIHSHPADEHHFVVE